MRSTPLFAIAVAGELAGMHPQTLRQYDRLGLVSPRRTAGQSRRYSMRDVVAAARDRAPLRRGAFNLEGIRRILELEDQVGGLALRVRELESALADEVSSTVPAAASSPQASKAMSCRSAPAVSRVKKSELRSSSGACPVLAPTRCRYRRRHAPCARTWSSPP